MPVVASVHAFLEVARKSKQIDNARLEAFLGARDDVPSDPRKLAALLIRQEGRMYYLVMEYVDGPNLHQLIVRHGALDVPLACEYVRQAAVGLHHAHQAGLVHRDVKPANVLIAGGTIKILDLGLARVSGE